MISLITEVNGDQQQRVNKTSGGVNCVVLKQWEGDFLIKVVW